MSKIRRFLTVLHFNSERIVLCAIYLLTAMLFLLSQESYFADSEIWGITLSKNVWDFSVGNFSLMFKFPFYSLLRLLYEIPGDNYHHLIYARILFFCVSLAVLVLTYLIARKVYFKSYIAIIAVFLVLTTTVYLNRSFRVRSDILSLLFSLILIYVNIGYFESNIRKTWKSHTFKVILLFALIICSTPKAVYLIFWNLLFVLLLRFKKPPLDRVIYFKPYKYGIIYPICAGLAFLLVSTVFSWLGGSNKLYVAYYGAWRYFYDALVTWDLSNFASQKFHFFSRFLVQNIVFLTLAFIPMVKSFTEIIVKRAITYENAFRVSTFIYFLSVFSYNDLLPFFIATWVPFLAISAAGYVYSIPLVFGRTVFYRSKTMIYMRTPIVLLMVAFFSYGAGEFFILNMAKNSNFTQRATIRGIQRYLSLLGETNHYDVIGILPRNNSIYKFAGPGQAYQIRVVGEYIDEIKPNFIFYVRKAALLEPKLSEILNKSYADLGYGIFGRGVRIFSKPPTVNASDGLLSFEQIAKGIETIEGRSYWVIPSDVIAKSLESNFIDIYENKVFFYVQPQENTGKVDKVMYRKDGKLKRSIALLEFQPRELIDRGEFLIYTGVSNISITKFPPIKLPYESHMLFEFEYDVDF